MFAIFGKTTQLTHFQILQIAIAIMVVRNNNAQGIIKEKKIILCLSKRKRRFLY